MQQGIWTGYRRAARYLAPYRWPLTGVLLAGIAATSFGLVQPYISKLLIDQALLNRDFHALVVVSGVMLLATVAGFVLNIFSSYQYVRVSAAVLFDMRVDLYRHLQRLSPSFWAKYKMGDVVSRINNDIAEVQRVSSDSLLSVLSNVVFLIGAAAIMASLNSTVFLFSVAVLPLSVWTLRYYQKRLTGRVKAVREQSAGIGSFLLETLLGIRLVVASNAQRREVERFQKRNQSFLEALLAMQLTSFLSAAVPGALLTLATAGLFLYGGKLVIDGRLSTGSLVALMAYHARLLSPVQNLMSLYANLVTGSVSLERVWELFDTPVDIVEPAEAKAWPRENARGEIEFEGVTFRHGDRVVLDALAFRIPAGAVCAVMGPSGVGKSTLAELLVRFRDPSSGSVRMDGEDIRNLKIEDLRRNVMLLDQQPYLLHASVRDNIAYVRPEATDAEILDAAKAAAIDERIAALPEGYATVLAERGQTLSAGERQRLSLARAILANPKVLVLDEPTSALDEETERAIAETLRSRVAAGRTIVLITHRPAIAKAIADQVVTLG